MLDNKKIARDTAKFNQCVSGYDLLNIMGREEDFGGLSNQLSPTEGIQYARLNKWASETGNKISLQTKIKYASTFLFYSLNKDAHSHLHARIITGWDMHMKIAEGDESWIFIGSAKHEPKETARRMEFITALDTLADLEKITSFSEYPDADTVAMDTALRRLNLTHSKVKKLRKIVEEFEMWEIRNHECSDFSSRVGIPSWFSELLSRFRGDEQPLEATA